jgi:hypothetical protein
MVGAHVDAGNGDSRARGDPTDQLLAQPWGADAFEGHSGSAASGSGAPLPMLAGGLLIVIVARSLSPGSGRPRSPGPRGGSRLPTPSRDARAAHWLAATRATVGRVSGLLRAP